MIHDTSSSTVPGMKSAIFHNRTNNTHVKTKLSKSVKHLEIAPGWAKFFETHQNIVSGHWLITVVYNTMSFNKFSSFV